MAYPKTTLAGAILLVVFSGVYLWETFSLQNSGVNTSGSGPMDYPLTVGVPLAILSGLFLVTTIKNFHSNNQLAPVETSSSENDGAAENSPNSSTAHSSSAIQIEAPIVMGIAIVHALLLPIWGYLLGTAVFTFALAYVVRGTLRPQLKQILGMVGFALAVSIITYFALDYGLGIPLPEGNIGLGGF